MVAHGAHSEDLEVGVMTVGKLRGHPSAMFAGGLGVAIVMSLVSTSAIAAPTPVPTVKPVACAPEAGVDSGSIKIGIVTPKTGAAAPTFDGYWQAAQVRFDQENAKGGVNGRKIKATVYDDQGSSSGQTTAATKALDQDNVFGIVVGSSTDSMEPLLLQRNVPVTGYNQLAMATNRNAFSATGVSTPLAISTAILERLKADGATKIANINHATPGATTSANAYSKIASAVPGLTEVLRIADEPQGAHDATSTALRIRNSGADAWIGTMFVDGGISIGQALNAQGVKLKTGTIAGLTDPAIIAKGGSALEGIIGSTSGPVPITSNVRAAKTVLSALKAAGVNPYNASSAVGYAAADLMVTGLKKAGKCPTRQAFIDNLRQLKGYTANGFLPGPIDFTPGITPNGNPAKCSWFVKVINGAPVADKKATCGAIIELATGKAIG